ncbi:large ribosomal subunit protein bL33m isoform X1 [Cylas formicarius]|uniref:large ribosomal subunit protein bL33m isoform X1 n=1 Tax=Cylas formicarius TaxID=197179 RepID=UPI0029584428|nr:large ribosomal subunit protein bL33m isoform X1 [Cylas formicarius]
MVQKSKNQILVIYLLWVNVLDYSHIMFITNILLKRVKSKDIMVQMESLVSGHTFNKIRPRLADKLEVIRFDPYIQKESVYREKKKVRSM